MRSALVTDTMIEQCVINVIKKSFIIVRDDSIDIIKSILHQLHYQSRLKYAFSDIYAAANVRFTKYICYLTICGSLHQIPMQAGPLSAWT